MKKAMYIFALIALPVGAFFAGKEFSKPKGEDPEIKNKTMQMSTLSGNSISPEEANTFFNNYYDQAERYRQPFSGISFTRPLLNELQKIFDNPDNILCKLYMGRSGDDLGYILVGADSAGIDLTANGIYYYTSSDSVQARICPKACDISSPIICPKLCTKEEVEKPALPEPEI